MKIRQNDVMSRRSDGRFTGFLSSIICCIGMFLLLAVMAVTVAGSGKGIAGYRCFHILTGSMNSVYPKGSMVIVEEKGKNEIEVGDDISFYTDPYTIVTHRVVDILDNYDEDGSMGYQTQGTESLNPDPDISHENNVIGKVVYCIPHLGKILEFIRRHLLFIAIMSGAVILCQAMARLLVELSRQNKRKTE